MKNEWPPRVIFTTMAIAALLIIASLLSGGCVQERYYALYAVHQDGRTNQSTIGSVGTAASVADHTRAPAYAADPACAGATPGETPAARAAGTAVVNIAGNAGIEKTIDAATELALMERLRNANASGRGDAKGDIDDKDTLTPTLNVPVAGPGGISSVQPGGGAKSGLAEFVTEKARAIFDGKDKDASGGGTAADSGGAAKTEDCPDCIPTP